jgi:transaldolase
MVGIVNAKRIWQENQAFWNANRTPLAQEMIFASTGTKKPEDKPWKYVAAFCGSDIETNPPTTNQAAADSGLTFTREVDDLPPAEVLADIDAKVDMAKMEEVLMSEGIDKFANPQKALLQLIADKRKSLASIR